jgi:hypothetical protein
MSLLGLRRVMGFAVSRVGEKQAAFTRESAASAGTAVREVKVEAPVIGD